MWGKGAAAGRLYGGVEPPGGARAGAGLGGRGVDLDVYVQEHVQQQVMRQQDEVLGDIEMQVGR